MSKNKILFFSILVLSFFVLVPAVQAQGFLDDAGLSAACTENGQCSLDDVAAGFLSLIRLLLGGIAALALVFMVWGGVQWVWSGGNADKVKRGKDIFFNTIAALVLAFGSFMITSFFINDILQPKSEFRVTSEDGIANECIGKSMFETCNLPQINYICSGPEHDDRCMTKCDFPRTVAPELLNGAGVVFRCGLLSQNPGAFNYTNLCPGDEDRVCILFNSSGAVSQSEVESNAVYSNVIDSLTNDYLWPNPSWEFLRNLRTR